MEQPIVDSITTSFDFSDHDQKQYQSSGKANQAPQKNANRPGKGNDPFSEPPEQKGPTLLCNRQTTLRFNNLKQATEVLGKLTVIDSVRKSREIRLYPLQAKVKDPTPHENKARLLAVKMCKERASLLAEANELQLGAAIAVVDEANSARVRESYFLPPSDPFGIATPPQNRESELSLAFVAFREEPVVDLNLIPPAHLKIAVTVSITYEVKPKVK